MQRIIYFLQSELKQLCKINYSDRRWELPLAAAIATGVPLLIGCFFDHFEYGLLSSLGAMIFLYVPNTNLVHRMLVMICASSGISACFMLGLLSHFYMSFFPFTIMFATVIVTSICRYFKIPPPGSLFFILAVCVAAYMPADILQIPYRIGLVFLGALFSCSIAFIYSLLMLWKHPAKPFDGKFTVNLDFTIIDSIIIGIFIGASVFIAELLQLQHAYWVPITCLILIQGQQFSAICYKAIHRIIGTAFGLFLAWFLLSLNFNMWATCFIMMSLTFIIEFWIVRYYGIAVIFITPLTIFLAEAGSLMSLNPSQLIVARFYDIVLGGLIGFIGGYCIHKTSLRIQIKKVIYFIFPNHAPQ